MKINRLETHDRLQHFVKDQSANIFQGAEDCLKQNPDSLAIQEKCPYIYLFAHPRTHDNGVDKVMYWQPRISIPKAQTNSYLFRALSHTDMIEVVWLLPPRELWSQYDFGKVTESDLIAWSINQFRYNREELEKPHPDDLPEERASLIRKAIVDERLQEIRNKKNRQSIINEIVDNVKCFFNEE